MIFLSDQINHIYLIKMFNIRSNPPNERQYDSVTTEYSFAMSDLAASEILSDESGKFAMKAVYR